MAKVLLYAHDPGGANALSPLVDELESRGHDVVVYGDGPALRFLKNARRCLESPDDLLNRISPDFLFTGTSASDAREKELRVCAVARKTPCASVLDHWVNYGTRFTRYSTSELDLYRAAPVFDRLPDYIIVMDETAKEEMAREGIPARMIYPLGNPHFDVLKSRFASLDVKDLRGRLLDGADKLVVFASEPYTEDYGKGGELAALQALAGILPDGVRLVVKPHPRECKDKFKDVNAYILPQSISSIEAIKASDVVVSMTSMVLIESLICGRKAVSYQPDSFSKDKFILTKMGVLPFINKESELEFFIRQVLSDDYQPKVLAVNGRSAQRIIDFMEEKICQD